ncbi:MAG: 16S rRNA (guanine(527)-N(7))-methyltransferase RsmG [bacterium]|nr:16S rRNA (guanine(527)-N(7))-methyltransferase RsmG [bacterium]
MDFDYRDNLKSLNMALLDNDKIVKIIGYIDFLKNENEKKNLISRKANDQDIFRFIGSSLVFAKYIADFNVAKVLDIGSGAGFPAVICAICLPEVCFSVMDSTQKKIDFLYDVASHLGLGNIECFWGRIEDFGGAKGLKEDFDICTAMAVGGIELTTGYAFPFLRKGGVFLTIKSYNQEKEFEEAMKFVASKSLEMQIKKEEEVESFLLVIS